MNEQPANPIRDNRKAGVLPSGPVRNPAQPSKSTLQGLDFLIFHDCGVFDVRLANGIRVEVERYRSWWGGIAQKVTFWSAQGTLLREECSVQGAREFIEKYGSSAFED